jgi:APA family basic amino acid/polyamine antiporter
MTETERQEPSKVKSEQSGGGFGLTTAIALIMGSIIGVGIFNLPTSLAAYGPITLVSMALTTIGAIASPYSSAPCPGVCRPTGVRTLTRG